LQLQLHNKIIIIRIFIFIKSFAIKFFIYFLLINIYKKEDGPIFINYDNFYIINYDNFQYSCIKNQNKKLYYIIINL